MKWKLASNSYLSEDAKLNGQRGGRGFGECACSNVLCVINPLVNCGIRSDRNFCNLLVYGESLVGKLCTDRVYQTVSVSQSLGCCRFIPRRSLQIVPNSAYFIKFILPAGLSPSVYR